jgi:polyprenyl-phospho-N-acetylgalactosaminyl synthase
MGTLFAVIAAHNEARAIGPVIAGLARVVDRVIVVDDGSADDTGAMALAHGAELLVHRINLGQGAALQTGIRYALRERADLIVTFDADGQHSPEDVPCMVEALHKAGADIAIGSRFLGSTEAISWIRRIVLRGAVVYTRAATGLPVTDAHNGLRVLTRKAAGSIVIRQNRMAHASEILDEVARRGLRFVEVPVHVRYTPYSISKGQKLSGAFEILIDLMSGHFFK